MRWPRRRRATKASDLAEATDMPLVAHLGELRARLIKCVIAVVLGAVIIVAFNGPIFRFLSEPYCSVSPAVAAGGDARECVFLATSPLAEFDVMISMAGWGGLILALPVIIYQLTRFLMPALYPNERRVIVPVMLASLVLLALGLISAYLILPRSLEVLGSILPEDRVQEFYTADAYLSFFVKMMLAFGVAFEFPLVLVLLQAIGVVNPTTLRKQRRLAIVVVVIAAAIITPTGDPFTLGVVAVPMYLFYEIAVMIGAVLHRRRVQPA